MTRASSDQVGLPTALQERDRGEEVDDLAVRHPGRASRTRAHPGVSSAVSIEYSGTSNQLEASTVRGSEAMITERGGSPAVICQPPSFSAYSPPIAYQRLTNGRSVSSISSSGGYQP